MARRLVQNPKRRTIVRRSAPKRLKVDGLKQEEVSFLFDKLVSEERAEAAWIRMTESPPDDRTDWTVVEEHLLTRPAEANHGLRRWKHFGK